MIYSNILLIDDDEDDQEIFISALEKISKVVTFNALCNAKEALEKLENKQINPDVIFLDLNMPIMNGQQFLIEVKKKKDLMQIPIIIFSTSSHLPTIKLVKELGAHDFITKPNRYDDLVNILKAVFKLD